MALLTALALFGASDTTAEAQSSTNGTPAAQGAAAPNVAAVPVAGRTSPAAQTLSRCVQSNGRLAVLFLLDESGSLKITDPLGARVDGVKAALAGFARLAATRVGGRRPEVQVALMGFAGRLDPDPDSPALSWSRLDEGSLDALLGKAERFRGRDDRTDTDYALALRGARTALGKQVVAMTQVGGASPCKALIWFTDGGYELTDRSGSPDGLPTSVPYAPGIRVVGSGVDQALAAGRQYLCRSDGLMDGLVSDEVVKFTVALSTRISPEDENLLRRLTSGACGNSVSPQTGELVSVSNADCLFFGFGGLLAGRGCPPPRGVVCARNPCARGSNAFRTEPGLGSFLISAATGASGIEIELRGPRGGSMRLRPGAPTHFNLDGAQLTQRWVSARAVEIDGALPADREDWIGPWSYTFVDPQATHPEVVPISTVSLSADLQPKVTGAPEVVRGRTTNVELMLARSSGKVVDSGALVDRARLSATVTDPRSGRTTPVTIALRGNGAWKAALNIPADSTAPFVYLNVNTTFTGGDGTVSTTPQRSIRLAVVLPPGEGFPTLSPTELSFKSISGKGRRTTRLTVTGSPEASGCVWIGGVSTDLPRSAKAEVTLRPDARRERDCVRVGKNQRRVVEIMLAVQKSTAGRAQISIPVTLRSDLTDRKVVTRVEATADLYPNPDIGKRILIIVLGTLLGLLIPIALLVLLNKRMARLVPPQQIRTLAREVVVEHAGAIRSAAGGPVSAEYVEFTPVSTEGMDRAQPRMSIISSPPDSASLDDADLRVRAVAIKTPGDLFTGPRGIASASGMPRLYAGNVAGGELRTWSDGAEHEVPLSLAGTWLFLPGRAVEDRRPGTMAGGVVHQYGTLVLILAEGAALKAGADLVSNAERDLTAREWKPARGDDEGKDRSSRPLSRLRAVLARKRHETSEDDGWYDESLSDGDSTAGDPFADRPVAGLRESDESPSDNDEDAPPSGHVF